MATLERGPNERNNMATNNAKILERIEREEKELKALEAEFYKEKEEVEEVEEEVEEETTESSEETTEEETTEETEELSDEEQTFKKRYGDLRRHSQEKIKELEAKIDSLQKETPSDPTTASEEDVKAWVTKYPQIAAIVETLATKKAKDLFDADVTDVKKSMSELTREKGELEIKKAHSDYDKLKEDNAFHDWAEEQPKWVQDALYSQSNDPRSVIRVLDLYKMDKGLDKDSKKKKDLEAATAVKTKVKADEPDVDRGKGKVYKDSQVAKMSLKQYEKEEADILKAQREGRYLYGQ